MTTPVGPDFTVGMAVEHRQLAGQGIGKYAAAHVGHAVTPDSVREGESASRAVCGTMSTVDDPNRKYRAHRSAAYVGCPRCIHYVTSARG